MTEGLASFSRPSLSWEEEGGQGPRAEYHWSSPCACHRSGGRAGLLELLGPSPVFKEGGPKSSLGINGTCRVGGGGLGQEHELPGHLACWAFPSRVALN